jgi:hypothetical protein
MYSGLASSEYFFLLIQRINDLAHLRLFVSSLVSFFRRSRSTVSRFAYCPSLYSICFTRPERRPFTIHISRRQSDQILLSPRIF